MADYSSYDTPLHIAAGCGDVERVRRLLNSKQYEVDVRNSHEQTPLHLACANGQIGVVDLLVSEFGASINLVDNDKYTPLILGAKSFGFQVVVVLLYLMITKSKACLIDKCHIDILENFILRLYNDSKAQEEAWWLFVSKHGFPFDSQSENNQPIFIIILLVGVFGLSSLINVIEQNEKYIQLAKVKESSILHFACMGGYIEESITEKFWKKAPFDTVSDDQYPLLKSRGHLELIDKLILKYHFDPNAKTIYGNTPLHIAAIYGRIDTAKHLITEYKVETDARNIKNDTPLCLASWKGHTHLVKVLIEKFNCSPIVHGFRDQNSSSLRLPK